MNGKTPTFDLHKNAAAVRIRKATKVYKTKPNEIMVEQYPLPYKMKETDYDSATPSLKQEMNLSRRACWCNNERCDAQERCESCVYLENVIETDDHDDVDDDDDDGDDEDDDDDDENEYDEKNNDDGYENKPDNVDDDNNNNNYDGANRAGENMMINFENGDKNNRNNRNNRNKNNNVTTVLNGAKHIETTNLIDIYRVRSPKLNSITTIRKLMKNNVKGDVYVDDDDDDDDADTCVRKPKASETLNANLNINLSNNNNNNNNNLIKSNNYITATTTISNDNGDDVVLSDAVAVNGVNGTAAATIVTVDALVSFFYRFWLAFVVFCDRMTLKLDDPRFAGACKQKRAAAAMASSAQTHHTSGKSQLNSTTPPTDDTSKSKKPTKFSLITSKKVIFLFLVCVFFSCVNRIEARPNTSTTASNAILSDSLANGGAAAAAADSAGVVLADIAAGRLTVDSKSNEGSEAAMAAALTNNEAEPEKKDMKNGEEDAPHRYPLSQVEFDRVKTPFIIGIWILSASIAKIGFHMTPKLHLIFPESCLLIVVGVVIGVVLYFGTEVAVSPLTPNTFFFYMLPPIILDAGYFMPNRLFFDNLGTILLMAVVGTIFNIATIGGSLWAIGLTGLYGVADTPRFLDTFLFASLISAVDPVAVLAVFEEIHVNEILYIVVFGESLLNDAVTVVMYHMMEVYNEIGISNIIAQDLVSGVGSFFVVAIGGTIIGIIWGFLTGLVTRFTDHVRVIEPIFIFVMAYLAYLNAEIFHMSGILAITFCGITMKNYVESNISQKSHTTVKYALKMLSSSSETIIFMFLGVATVKNNHVWNTWFVLLTIVFCSVFRVLGVIILTALANRFRLHKLSRVDQFVMSYGGLRGAVAFALVLLINEDVVKQKDMFVTTTIAVIYFTVFLQGITIKPLVKILNVKRANKRKPTMNERIHERFMDHLMAGIEDIVGKTGNYNVRDKFKRFDNRFIRPLLIRDLKGAEPKIIETYSKLTMRDAMEVMRRNPSTIGQITGTESMSALFRNYTNNCIGGSPSLTNLENTCSRNLDMHELDYNPSKKDLTDAKIHHLLAEELKPYRRHRRLSYSRHAVDDRDLSTQVNYKMQMNFRRMFNDRKHHKRSKRGASNKLLQPDAAGVKQNHVSFHDFQQNGTTKQFSNEESQAKLTEVTVQNANDDWDDGLTFTAKSSLAENPIPEEDRNVSRDSDGERRVATPTATESQLPWKRQGDEISDAVQQNEFPAWASNKEYLAYNSPSATFLGGINKPKQPKSVIGLFRRESSKSGGSVNNDAILPADVSIFAPRGSDPALAAVLSGMVVPSAQQQHHPPRMDKRSQSISAASGLGEGHAGPFPVTASHRRNVRRGSMLELSGEPIPEESYYHGYSKSLCEPDGAVSGDEWAVVQPERASSAGGNNDRFLRSGSGGGGGGASVREPLLPKLTPRAQIRRMGATTGSRSQVTSSLLSTSNSDFDDDEDEDLDLYDDENIVVTTTTTAAPVAVAAAAAAAAGVGNPNTEPNGRNRNNSGSNGSAAATTTTTTIRLGRNNDESII